MAEKFERTYNVPLRRGFIRTPRHNKAKKAVSTLKSFIRQHTKAETIKIGPELNKKIWKNGISYMGFRKLWVLPNQRSERI